MIDSFKPLHTNTLDALLIGSLKCIVFGGSAMNQITFIMTSIEIRKRTISVEDRGLTNLG